MTPVEQQIVNAIRTLEPLFDSSESEQMLDAVAHETGFSKEIVKAAYDKLYPAQVEQAGDEEDSTAAPVVQPAPEVKPELPASKFREIAMGAMGRGETRVLPIKVGGKNPLTKWLGSELDTYGLDEWNQLALKQIDIFAEAFPDASGCVLAKADEFCFIDCDTHREFVAGYEKCSGEKFPVTYTTSARDNRVQIHFRQTAKTREMGNVHQFKVDGIDLSVRQHNLYVLAEGSDHPTGSKYQRVIDAPIISMPDKMVEYIDQLQTKTRPASASSEPEQQRPAGNWEQELEQHLAGPDIVQSNPSRDETLTSIFGRFRQVYGLTPEQLYEIGCQINQARCKPPLSETDVKKSANSIGKKPIKGNTPIPVPFGEGYKIAQQQR